jgi:putative hydrolase of the HAD superfamily
VLLDPDRAGAGPWAVELEARFGAGFDLVDFFRRSWPDVIVGRRDVEGALAAALATTTAGFDASVEEVLSCWFEADFVPHAEVMDAAAAWADEGVDLVLVTNQEHRRAAYLLDRFRTVLPVRAIAYSAAVGHVKADPRFFVGACAQLGIGDEDRVVFVDDLLENVRIAQLHGWEGVHFVPGSDWREQIGAALDVPR